MIRAQVLAFLLSLPPWVGDRLEAQDTREARLGEVAASVEKAVLTATCQDRKSVV